MTDTKAKQREPGKIVGHQDRQLMTALPLSKLTDYHQSKYGNALLDGDTLVYDGSEWFNGAAPTNVSTWSATHSYKKHELVWFEDGLYRAAQPNVNTPPNSHVHAWDKAGVNARLWQPNMEWNKGDIALVGFQSQFLNGREHGNTDLGGSFTVWMCVSHVPANMPADPAAAGISQSEVPPGQYKLNRYDKFFPRDPGDTGPEYDASVIEVHDSGNWVCFSQPTLVFFASLKDMREFAVHDEVIIPGTVCLINEGTDRGQIWRWNTSNNNTKDRGWKKLTEFGAAPLRRPDSLQIGYGDTTIYAPTEKSGGSTAPAGEITMPMGANGAHSVVKFADFTSLDAGGAQIGHVAEPTELDSAATKKYVDEAVAPLITGIKHGAAVTAIANSPPPHAVQGELVIVGTAPTGAFAGKPNHVAFFQNAAWTFTPPTANEAHLNQADNSIYHWSGTAWNKIGSASASALDDLTDVDVTTVAPVEGSRLIYKNGVWQPSEAGAPNSAVTLGSVQTIKESIRAAGVPYVIDFTRKDWHTIIIDGFIEIRDADTHISWSGDRADGVAALTVVNLTQASTQIVWAGSHGQDGRGYIAHDSEFYSGADKFSLTWLVGTAAANDRISSTRGNYSAFTMKFHRWYDDYLTVHSRINYAAYAGNTYMVECIWQFNHAAALKEMTKLRISPVSALARIAVGGIYTIN